MSEIKLQKIEYYRQVKPPTLLQYVYRRTVKEAMKQVEGKVGVTVNPDTGHPIPKSALAAKQSLKGLTAEEILRQHPEWRDDYEREKNIHP